MTGFSRAFLLCWVFAQLAASGVEIIAHRGASADAPENTLSAMQLAWEQQADAIELDLWLSADGKLVVFHDADTKRFESVARRIPSLSWEEAQKLDVGTWKDPKYKGERIPTLESILATVPPGKRAVLEIKCGPEILPEFKKVLAASGRKPRELVVISFRYDTLSESKKIFPDIEHYFLHDYKKDKAGEYPQLQPIIARCKEADFEGLNLNFNWPIDKKFTETVKAAGLKLFVWTVDDSAIAKRVAEAGVDGITTNRPKWLRDQLATQ